ncbi:hypothetical protein FZEAL_7217 [Fusarium zealandicum]|uniref:Ferric oxidoreductase domain-containing protein n=1 Tax=Fusarium zealandicum TaxID=1053134 RepID=A0A8H4XIP2_9HYPO|nr:hypothetical protein FZEAL_7217 [Fusarium zealandicum]
MTPSNSFSAAIAALFVFLLPSSAATELLEGYGRDAYKLPCGQACGFSVPTTLNCPEFAGLSAEQLVLAYPSPACMANDSAYLTSIAWCIDNRCDKSTKPEAINEFWNSALIAGQNEPGVILRYSYDEALAQIDRKNPPEPLNLTEISLNRTIEVTDDVYLSFMNAVKAYETSGTNESKYSLLAFLSGVFVPIAFSLLRFVPIPPPLQSKLYAYFIDPPAWGKKHSVPILGLGLVPTRGQALFILYIIAINAIATFEGYPTFAPNGMFPDRRYDLIRQIGNRAGVIAFANTPLIILYAGRNSLLLWLTNWSHSTFLLLHRWIAMISIIQVALHSLMWLQLVVESDSHASSVVLPYWYWGVVATLAFCLMFPFSLQWMRRAMYEVFLLAHICLAVLALVGSWYHIWYLYKDSSGFEIWLLIAMAVWGFERLLRIVRIARHGVKRAYITRVDDKYLRIDIPGTTCSGHCFAYFPTLSWRVWENHPFSVVNCQTPNQTDSQILSSPSDHESPVSLSNSVEGSTSKETGVAASDSHNPVTHNDTRPGITLFIRAQSGFTRQLAKYADSKSGVPILLEASYGHEGEVGTSSRLSPTPEYPNILCIAGGVGITGVFPALSNSLSTAKPLGTTKLYWGIRDQGLVDAVKDMIVGTNTREKAMGEQRQDTNWGNIEPHVTVGSRMDIKQVLQDELKDSVGGTTVIVCGPLPMCDEVRYICAAMARHGTVLRYREESFSW